MARSLTRAQQLQNRAFLKALRRSGNVKLSAIFSPMVRRNQCRIQSHAMPPR